MKNQRIAVKIFAFIAMLSGMLWIGAYAVRMMISYSHFDAQMNLVIPNEAEVLKSLLLSINPVINTTFILYILFIITYTLFLISSNIKLKNSGWLFLISAIVYLTLPFEVYLMTIDYKLIIQLNFTEVINTEYSINLIRDRFTDLGGFPVIIILSYCSMVYFLLFKPFSIEIKNEN